LDAERFDSGTDGDNVGDGIESADFVKLDILWRDSVDLSLRQRDALEHGNASGLDRFGQPAAPDQAADFPMTGAVNVAVGGMLVEILQTSLELPTGDALARFPSKTEVNHCREIHRGDGRTKNFLLHAKIA